MGNNLDVWKTLFTSDFNVSKYLYHYTSVETAIKIVRSDRFLFSPISKTNDTSEAKMKIFFQVPQFQLGMNDEDYDQKITKIREYFNSYKPYVRILCFSMDSKISKKDLAKSSKNMIEKAKFYDVLGRGFALPRMWAQYAKDNSGVCFVINKDKLLNCVKRQIAFFKGAPVSYKNFFDRYTITAEHMEELTEKIDMIGNGGLTLFGMLQNDKDFLEYNFLEKLEDWKSEHEYRIIALTDNSDSTIFVKNLSSFLCGVVLGEKIDEDYEYIVKMLLQTNKIECDVKKIFFGSDCCRLIE